MLLLLHPARYLLRIDKGLHILEGILRKQWHVNTNTKLRHRFIVGTDFCVLNANITLK